MFLEITNPMDYRAALYVRLSKEDENEGPSQSVTNQKSLLYEFTEKHRVSVYDIYVDDGFSGTSFDRPDFNRMIRDIEDHKVNMVITKDLSRLGRDYIMTGHYMERYFPEHQVRYISLLDGIDTGVESTANDITPFRAIMNDMYAKDISKKIKSVKHDKQKKGLFIGWKPPFGYKSHPDTTNKLIIDEEAASVVRRIFAMALAGMSCRHIADKLNDEGVPTCATYANFPVGRPGKFTGLWSSSRISEMLKNQVYIGNMVQGRMVKVSYKSRKYIKRPPEQWIIVEHTHEPIIDEDSFRKVGQMLRSRAHTRCRTYDYLLKGMVYCHECGASLVVLNRPTKTCDTRLFFICLTYQRFTKSHVCTCHSIKVDTLTESVLAKVREVCSNYLNTTKLVPIAQQSIQRAKLQNSVETEIQTIERKLKSMSTNLDQMYSDRLAGILDPEDFQRIYSKIKAERITLTEKLNTLQTQKEAPVETEDQARSLAQRFLEGTSCNRELLTSLIERIEYSEDRQVYIKFRFKSLNS